MTMTNERAGLGRWTRLFPWTLALVLALGWTTREAARALDERPSAVVTSGTVNLDQVKMSEFRYQGALVGKVGRYVAGETPASSLFVTGRFVLEPGQTPHAPHVHLEEEVMIVASGEGEIFCDGKTTKVGPGSVMFTTPQAPHGITNTGSTPLLFYFVKWAPRPKG